MSGPALVREGAPGRLSSVRPDFFGVANRSCTQGSLGTSHAPTAHERTATWLNVGAAAQEVVYMPAARAMTRRRDPSNGAWSFDPPSVEFDGRRMIRPAFQNGWSHPWPHPASDNSERGLRTGSDRLCVAKVVSSAASTASTAPTDQTRGYNMNENGSEWGKGPDPDRGGSGRGRVGARAGAGARASEG